VSAGHVAGRHQVPHGEPVARRSAVQARTQTINQMYAVVVGMARLRSTTTALKWPRVAVVARLTYSGPTLRIGGPPPDSVLA
jgi:hypothetical protein